MARLTRAQKRAANRAAFRAERGGRRGSSLYAGKSTMDALTAVQDAWRAGDEVWLEEATARFERITGQAVPHTYRSIPKHLLKRNPMKRHRNPKRRHRKFSPEDHWYNRDSAGEMVYRDRQMSRLAGRADLIRELRHEDTRRMYIGRLHGNDASRPAEWFAKQIGFASAKEALSWLKNHGISTTMTNPRVSFRTCKGKKVTFKAKRRRKGKTPKHLRKYLFKKGHKPRKRCAKRSGRGRRRR